MDDKVRLTKQFFNAFAAGDRSFIDNLLDDSYTFSSPHDPSLTKAEYFDKCWPGAGKNQQFDFIRSIEHGNEVIITYEIVGSDGSRGRNTEILTYNDANKVTRTEVYFGWSIFV